MKISTCIKQILREKLRAIGCGSSNAQPIRLYDLPIYCTVEFFENGSIYVKMLKDYNRYARDKFHIIKIENDIKNPEYDIEKIIEDKVMPVIKRIKAIDPIFIDTQASMNPKETELYVRKFVDIDTRFTARIKVTANFSHCVQSPSIKCVSLIMPVQQNTARHIAFNVKAYFSNMQPVVIVQDTFFALKEFNGRVVDSEVIDGIIRCHKQIR